MWFTHIFTLQRNEGWKIGNATLITIIILEKWCLEKKRSSVQVDLLYNTSMCWKVANTPKKSVLIIHGDSNEDDNDDGDGGRGGRGDDDVDDDNDNDDDSDDNDYIDDDDDNDDDDDDNNDGDFQNNSSDDNCNLKRLVMSYLIKYMYIK